jgi:hypothetical protein
MKRALLILCLLAAAPARADITCHAQEVQKKLFGALEAGAARYTADGKTVGQARAHKLFEVAPPRLDDIYVADKNPRTGALLCIGTLRFPLSRLNRAAFVVPPEGDTWDFENFAYVVRPSSDGSEVIVQLQDDDQYDASIGISLIRGITR